MDDLHMVQSCEGQSDELLPNVVFWRLTSIECILIVGAWVVRNLYPGTTPRGVMVDIEIGALIESMVCRFRRGSCKVVMKVRKTGGDCKIRLL